MASATSGTTTINRVDLNNTMLVFLSQKTSAVAASDELSWRARLSFQDATTVKAESNSNASVNNTVGFEVVEFWPGVMKSVQRGTIVYTGTSGTHTATINAVDLTRSSLQWLGTSGNDNAVAPIDRPDWTMHVLDFVNNTTVEATSLSDPNGSGFSWTVGFQVVEWN